MIEGISTIRAGKCDARPTSAPPSHHGRREKSARARAFLTASTTGVTSRRAHREGVVGVVVEDYCEGPVGADAHELALRPGVRQLGGCRLRPVETLVRRHRLNGSQTPCQQIAGQLDSSPQRSGMRLPGVGNLTTWVATVERSPRGSFPPTDAAAGPRNVTQGPRALRPRDGDSATKQREGARFQPLPQHAASHARSLADPS
eukprot:1181345-Prorocentrum_minimum.AAC.5